MIRWSPFSEKHRRYIKAGIKASFCVAEGAVRAGKTIDHCIIAAAYLETCPDRFHLATGSTIANAKLNIGVCNGYGLEALFRGRCRWGKYRDNEALFISTQTGEKVVIFSGGGKADSYKRILGNSYGLWIATEINEHYDSDDSRTSFIRVAMARQAAAIRPMRLWDLNPCSPSNTIYTRYIDKYRDEGVDGYIYEHFTIADNASISEANRQAFIDLYDKGSVWYRRDILGQRVVADGLIYQTFADDPRKWAMADSELEAKHRRDGHWRFNWVNIGVDFGGNGSAHTFVATAETWDGHLIALCSQRVEAKGLTVEQLVERFLTFEAGIQARYGNVTCVYCDSAEQTIINTFRDRSPVPVANARKNPINDRIRATDIMLSSHVFSYVDGACDSLVKALAECAWDKNKPGEWIRLDDGTSDIDTLDAFEYSWERYTRTLIREEEKE